MQNQNDVTALGGWGIKDFVITVLKLCTKKCDDGGGGQNCLKIERRHLWMMTPTLFTHLECFQQ